MDANNWKYRLNQLMELLEHELTTALREINQYFEVLGQPFDEKFRQYYLEMSTLRLNTSFDTIRLERRFDNDIVPNSSTSTVSNKGAKNANLLSSAQNIVSVPIEVSDSDGEDEKQQMQAVNDSIVKANDGNVKLERGRSDTPGVAASAEPDSNNGNKRSGVEHKAAIAAPIGSQRPPNSSSNQQKLLKRDANGFYKCNKCEYSNKHRGNFQIHQLKHSGVKRFKCQHCDYASGHKGNLNKHQRTHEQQKLIGAVQDPIGGLFACTHCDEEFVQLKGLRIHMTVSHKNDHTNAKPFQCTICNRRFVAKDARRRHLHSVHN